MKDENIRKTWEKFIEKYNELFKTNQEKWYDNLKKLEEHILINNQLPSTYNKIKKISNLGQWLLCQKRSYKNNDCIMKNEEIRKQWEEFIEKYKELF